MNSLSTPNFYPAEVVQAASFEKIKRTRSPLEHWSEPHRRLEEVRAAMTLNGAEPIRAKVKEIVPEYSYQPAHQGGEDSEGIAPAVLQRAAGHGQEVRPHVFSATEFTSVQRY